MSAPPFMSSFSAGLLLNRIVRSSSPHTCRMACSTTGVKVVVSTNGNCLTDSRRISRCDGANRLAAKMRLTR